MLLYKAQLELASPLGTPLAADTLFGHICWAMAYQEGEEKLAEFLDKMDSEMPPLVLSDPFPAGKLPVPVLPLQHNSHDVKRQDQYKELKKAACIDTEYLTACITNMDLESIMQQLKKQKELKLLKYPTPHNYVNRLGAGTVEGGVFFTEDIYPEACQTLYELYLFSEVYDAGQLRKIFNDALAGGYGRDKSTGRGVIKLLEIKQAELPCAENPNAVMLLGPCAPAENDPVKGFWSIKAKAGKLGGHWAISEYPFKKTIMMLQAGSILITDKCKPFYGRMVHDIHETLPQVVHYGISLALPVRLSQEVVEAA